MSAQQSNQVNEKQQDADALAVSACEDLELIYADTLLDQVDTAHQRIQEIQSDMSLLQTMENALGLISENMARVRRLAQDVLQNDTSHSEMGLLSDEILNLLMVNMLIVEDTEFNGHFLFKNDVISLHSFVGGELTLTTTNIPEISGTETGDFQAIVEDLDNAARIINRQYQRIGTVMQTLLHTYGQLQHEVDLLLNAQTQLIS
jgi:flagellin-like hook-associated protein FlgL